MTPDGFLRTVERLFAERGSEPYGGEAVTQLKHALQSADLARAEGGDSALVAAALLHDIGHLLHGLGSDCAEAGIDDRHEALGVRLLEKHLPPSVTEPVRLHVDAKRYLCAVDPGYLARLSEPSVLSLKLQGGPMTAEHADAFERNPHHEAAVRLRRWDDAAKVVGLATPDLTAFLPDVERCLVR